MQLASTAAVRSSREVTSPAGISRPLASPRAPGERWIRSTTSGPCQAGCKAKNAHLWYKSPAAHPLHREEALLLFTAAARDLRSELKAFALFSRSYLVLCRGTRSIFINFCNVQRAARSERMA